jgi:transcriptional regulator with XRE-family HTH domain
MTDTLNSRAAANLRAEIARKNITQEEIADRAGLSRQTVSNLLTGRTVIDLGRLELLAGILEVEPARLLTD